MYEINKQNGLERVEKYSIVETVLSDVFEWKQGKGRGSFHEGPGGFCNICVGEHIDVEILGLQEEA